LAAGQFADAIVVLHRACANNPQHPHVASRLAEVAQRQLTAIVTPHGNTTG
jgi:hypothetical protein